MIAVDGNEGRADGFQTVVSRAAPRGSRVVRFCQLLHPTYVTTAGT